MTGGQIVNNQSGKPTTGFNNNNKTGTPSEPKIQREPKSRSSRPPPSKRGGDNINIQETLVNGTSI